MSLRAVHDIVRSSASAALSSASRSSSVIRIVKNQSRATA